jgi:hypothetical protein
MVMPSLAHALVIPDSLLAQEATGVLCEHSTDLLFRRGFTIPGPIWLQPEICIQLAAVTE